MNIKEIPNEDIDFFKSIFSSKKDSIQDDIIFRIKYIIHLSRCFLLQTKLNKEFLEEYFSGICDSIDIKIENSPKDFVFYTISKKNTADNVFLQSIIDYASKIELTSYISNPDINKDGLSVFSDFTLKNCIPICFLKMKQNQLIESIYNLVCKYLEININCYKQNLDSIHIYKENFCNLEKETNNQAMSFMGSLVENNIYFGNIIYSVYDKQTNQVQSNEYYGYYQNKYDSPQEQNSQEQDFEYLYLKYDKNVNQWNILENNSCSNITKPPLSNFPGISYRFNYCSGKWETVGYFYNEEKDQWIEYDLLYKYYKNSPSGIYNIPAYPYHLNNSNKTPTELAIFEECNKNIQKKPHWIILYNKETKTWQTTRKELDVNLLQWVDIKFPYSNYKNPLNKSFLYARKLSSFVFFGTNDLTPFEITNEQVKNKIEISEKDKVLDPINSSLNNTKSPQTEKQNQTPYKKIHIDIDD